MNLAIFIEFLYNTLMTSTHTIRILALSTLFIPSIALAYTTPEEVLNGGGFPPLYTMNPGMTNDERVAAQQASAAAWRDSEQQKNYDAQHPAAPAAPAPAADQSSSKGELDKMLEVLQALKEVNGGATQTGPLSDEQLRAQRTLARVQQNQLQAQLNAQILASQETLHSGAPLADSGPATWIAFVLMAGAAFWILRSAKKLEEVDRIQE